MQMCKDYYLQPWGNMMGGPTYLVGAETFQSRRCSLVATFPLKIQEMQRNNFQPQLEPNGFLFKI